MEKTTLENSKPDQNEKAVSTMEKYKLEAEYDKLLLRRSGNSKRRRDEKGGLILVPVPPPFKNPANKWVEFEYDEQMEVWQRICVEAYCVGWLGFYDNENNVTNHKIFCDWEDIQSEKNEGKDPPAEGSKVTVYIDPGPQTLAVPLSDPPKPPPPPMS